MARKTSPPQSLLTVLRSAKMVFIGEALVMEDVQVPASQTSFRGAGYRITAQIKPQQALVGALPAGTVTVQGDTSRSVETRLDANSGLFPPDFLRQKEYWDYAQRNVPQQVVVALSEPPFVRVISGPEDDLPPALVQVQAWQQTPPGDQKSVILADLSRPAASPVASAAGFELLASQNQDLAALFEAFNRIPGRPGPAIQGILELLSRLGAGLPRPAEKELALKLLEGWKTETDPAALSGYLTWFDAHCENVLGADPALKLEVLSQAGRASSMAFSGPNAAQWERQVRYLASVLSSNLK